MFLLWERPNVTEEASEGCDCEVGTWFGRSSVCGWYEANSAYRREVARPGPCGAAARPTLGAVIVQLSDFHIGGEASIVDPEQRLEAAIAAVNRLPQRPDGVLVSGDLADDGSDASYERVRELLAPLQAPVYAMVGNHDSREEVARHFGVSRVQGYVQYVADIGPIHLIALDSQDPGSDAGSLDGGRLDWLEAQLAAAPRQPTIVALHHPPFSIGIAEADEIGLDGDDANELSRIIARHRQVQRVVCGHVHCVVAGDLAGRVTITSPSTYVELDPDFEAEGLEVRAGEPGFLVHRLAGDRIVTYSETVH